MLAQHWATCWCRRLSVGQTIGAAEDPPPPNRHVLAPINVGASLI